MNNLRFVADVCPKSPDIPSDFRTLFTSLGDDGSSLYAILVVCLYPKQPVLHSRAAFFTFGLNDRVADAVENKIIALAAKDGANSQKSLCALVDTFWEERIFPRLASLSPRSLLHATGLPTFVVESTEDDSVRISSGMMDAMRATESAWLRLLKPFPMKWDDTPVYSVEELMVLDCFYVGSHGSMLVLLPDKTTAVAVWVPTAVMLTDSSDSKNVVDGVYHEIEVLSSIPPHPNVVGRPQGYIVQEHSGQLLWIGFLSKFYPGGCVEDLLDDDNLIQLERRIRWAFQLSTALDHIHNVANSYHGDIKLSSVVLDEQDNAVLVDFAQAHPDDKASAPELYAASKASVSEDGRLSYHPPDKPAARLAQRTRPYDIWKDVPRALEAAEVYSFGIALCRLFEGQDEARSTVQRCIAKDPNDRPRFEDSTLR